jgi:hypothetical protein
LSDALQIQGRFSAIADISAAYVAISDRCIRPIINKMEQLALTKDGEDWKRKSKMFSIACEQAQKDINDVFKGTQQNMGRNMAKRIGELQTLAIEAAEENEENGF